MEKQQNRVYNGGEHTCLQRWWTHVFTKTKHTMESVSANLNKYGVNDVWLFKRWHGIVYVYIRVYEGYAWICHWTVSRGNIWTWDIS